eukprot:5800717-Prymnesium_polylepis.1
MRGESRLEDRAAAGSVRSDSSKSDEMDQLIEFLKRDVHGGTTLTGVLSSTDNQTLPIPAPPPSPKVCEGLRQAVDEALAMGLAPTSRVVKAA